MGFEKYKGLLKIAFILGVIILLCLIVFNQARSAETAQSSKTTTTITRKQVRFRPTVKIAAAGGAKKDRFNPEFRPGVARNTGLAARVGGARRLAYLSLLEAGSSSTSSEEA